MKKELNIFERAIIDEIVRFNGEKYPNLKKHICLLQIKFRNKTGVGMYVNFEYRHEISQIDSIQNDIVLSSDKSLELDSLKYELNFELKITEGIFDFLEIVTNGESWDGKYKSFNFVDNNIITSSSA